jgi:Metallo-beta-lactamase superfamily
MALSNNLRAYQNWLDKSVEITRMTGVPGQVVSTKSVTCRFFWMFHTLVRDYSDRGLMIDVHRLHLTDVTPAPNLPWARPTFPVFGYLIAHPTGPIIDTGVGTNSTFIDKLYSPVHHDLDNALSRHGVRVEDVQTVITSHLHFDHCGQNDRFGHSQIFVQRAIHSARMAFPVGIELTPIEGDLQIVDGVRIISTPGHTPGHQSVLIDDGNGRRTIVCCQASWNTDSFEAGALGDDGWNQDEGQTHWQNCERSTLTAWCSVTTSLTGAPCT